MRDDNLKSERPNLNSLCHLTKLKDVRLLDDCPIEGRFMDLSKLPSLEKLHLANLDVEGDLSDIKEYDFPRLKEFWPPNSKLVAFQRQAQWRWRCTG